MDRTRTIRKYIHSATYNDVQCWAVICNFISDVSKFKLDKKRTADVGIERCDRTRRGGGDMRGYDGRLPDLGRNCFCCGSEQ